MQHHLIDVKYPDDASLGVSHETIYRSLFIQARGVLKKELLDQLRSKRRMRRSRHATVSGQSRGQIIDVISIHERPAEVEDRAIPGWEGDLLSGAKNSYIATSRPCGPRSKTSAESCTRLCS
jgi:IS30 family transposase